MTWYLLMVPTFFCVLGLIRYVRGLIPIIDDGPEPPPHPWSENGTPLDDLPPETVNWDDFYLRLELFALTERTLT